LPSVTLSTRLPRFTSRAEHPADRPRRSVSRLPGDPSGPRGPGWGAARTAWTWM